MKFYSIFFILSIIWFIHTVSDPVRPEPDSGFCATSLEDPVLRERQESLEMQYIQSIQERSPIQRGLLPPYMLPVVVHIIHDNGAEDIPDAMVLQGIQHLNEAFADMGYYDQGDGYDTQIQFCLATRDPDGGPTTGINRVQSTLTDLNYSTQDLALKNLIRWDPLHYINIWLVREICNNNGCGVAGYAYYPGAHGSNVDGIVMEAKWFGSSNGNSGVQIHEMGHYLGLYHTFEGGCANDDCLSDGDRVCDTPPDQSTVPVPCGGSANSCSTDTQSGFATDQQDMFWNYMDYGDWDCYSAFSPGQADRMYWFIDNVRLSLLESEACQPPCLSPLTCSFSASANLVDVGTTVNFTNTSSNATSFQWLIDGVPFGVGVNAAFTFNTLGTFIVTLEAGNADPNCPGSFQDTIEVVCPVFASFAPSNLFPVPGEIVNFANNSIAATNFSWTVNGVAEANTAAFTYVFPSEGAYTVCLDVDNGLCEDQYCQLIFSFLPETSACGAGFVKWIGNPGKNEDAQWLLPTGDGDFLIGGQLDNLSQLTRVSAQGDLIWQKTFNFTSGDDFIRYLMIDSEGYLIMAGRDQFNSPCTNFIARFDLQTQTLLWTRTLPNLNVRIEGVLEKPANGNLLLYGSNTLTFNNYILEMNISTGAVLWQRDFDLGDNTDIFQRHFILGNDLYLAGAQRYLGGLDKIRASISRMDFNGNMDYTKVYFNTPNQQGRTYNEDIQIQGDTLVCLSRGVLTGDVLTNSGAQLFKTDPDGNPYWGKHYVINGGTFLFSRTLLPLPDGYILQGYFINGTAGEDIFFIRTDINGNLLWAKGVSTPDDDRCLSARIQDNSIYFAARSEGLDGSGNGDILFGSIPLDSEAINPNCNLFIDLDVYVVTIQNPFNTTVSLIENNPNNNWQSQNIAVQDSGSEIQSIPSCECSDTTACVTTFAKTLGTPEQEQGRRLIPEPGGGFLLGGSKGDSTLLVLLDGDGKPVWERTFKILALPEFVTELFIDSDQNLVMAGCTSPLGTQVQNYILKYDYQNDQVLWVKTAENLNQIDQGFFSIIEKSPGGNYLVAGHNSFNGLPGVGCDGLLFELDRNTGAPAWMNNYNLGSCETFFKVLLHANSLYTIGRNNFANAGTNKMRPAISQFDTNGNELWSRLYLVSVGGNTSARLYGTDLIVDNGLVALAYGDMSGTSTTAVEVQLFKTDFTGNMIWARRLNIPGGDTERSVRLLNLPDGYLLLGNYNAGGQEQVFLIKTDKNGLLQWSKTYGGLTGDRSYDILFQGGSLFWTGYTDSYGLGGQDIFLQRLDLQGFPSDTCTVVAPLTVTESAIGNAYSGAHPLTTFAGTMPLPDGLAEAAPAYLSETYLCDMPCVDSCLVAPDAFFQLLQGACLGGDSLFATLEICNEGEGILYAGTPLAFYEGDPDAGAPLLAVAGLPQDLGKDSCLSWDLSIPGTANTEIFVLLNAEGLAGFDGLECDLADNLGSFSVSYSPPLLDLGPDTLMCGFGVQSFEAGTGFTSWQWQDGSTESFYTATEPGAYWVTAVDSCGGVQSDTVSISIYSTAQSADTLLFCSGDTVVVFGAPVAAAGDYSALFTGFNGCDSLAILTLMEATDTIFTAQSAVICPDSSLTFYGAVLSSPGVYTNVDTSSSCVQVETLSLSVLTEQQTMESLSICADETADIFGAPLNTPGVYSQTFTAQNGCDSVHTIELFVLDTLLSGESITICANETADIFGIPTNMPGFYAMSFTGSNGCDSTHLISLTVLDTLATSESISTCANEPVDVFGVPTSMPGLYTQLFTAVNGCDSAHAILLTVFDTLETAEIISICSNETADVFGVQTNAPGVYSQTFSAATGCDSTHTITLTVFNTSAVFESIATCENEPVLIFGVPTAIAGTYTQNFQNQNGCDSTHAIQLSVLDTIASAESLSICNGETTLIFGVPVGVSGAYSQAFAGNNGCDSTHTVVLTVLDPVHFTVSVQDACIGVGGSAIATVIGGLPPYTYDWGNGPTSDSEIGNLMPGDYTLLVTDAFGCGTIVGFEVEGSIIPGISLDAGDVSCFGYTDGKLEVIAGDPGLSFSLDGQNFGAQTIFEDLTPGSYILYVQDANGCQAEFPFDIGQPDPLSVILPPDLSLQLGQADQIIPQVFPPDGVFQYAWSPPEGLSCADCPSPFVQPAYNTTYILVITDTLGCTAQAEIAVNVDLNRRVFIPNTFSPNADGTNDRFTVFGASELLRIRSLRIYDRWGDEVFEGLDLRPNDPGEGWDGTFRGKPMNAAVFGYVAELEFADGVVLVYHGGVGLVR